MIKKPINAKKNPFDCKQKRLELVVKKDPNSLGPGSYQPRNALQDRLIFKIQRGYRGQFGSTDQRFKI